MSPLSTKAFQREKKPTPSRALLTHFQHRSGLRRHPSSPCEGDRDLRWSDPDSVALFPFPFHFRSLFSFVCLLLLLLETKSDGSEPLFHFTYQSFDLVLYRVGTETFSSGRCLVGIGFGDFFQFECLPITLLLGSKPTAVPDIGCCGCS
uniref:Uncharacterized protein n=1 Tax=Fagus sylvatica TaxID=28930 RepID=A0A2N9FTG4_FAGSY